MSFIDLTGHRFGKLVVIERVGSRRGNALWRCHCDCGNTTEVVSSSLNNGETKSCGCLRKEVTRARLTTHGLCGTKLYAIWSTMTQRCNNSNSQHYQDYGGRGITVCDEWLTFEPFFDWAMANGYDSGLSIDRIDNEKGYFPANCKFSTQKEQCNNKRSNVWIEYDGRRRTLTQWSEVCGICYRTLMGRIRMGWSIEKILETPTRNLKRRKE